MKVNVNGKPDINRLAKALEEFFDTLTDEELDQIEQEEKQRKEELEQAG